MNLRQWDQPPTVLVADDEPSICLLVSEILGDCNLRVLTAADGPEALRILAQEQQQVVLAILDYSMPGMDCETLVRRIRETNGHIKLVISSGALEAIAGNGEMPQVDGTIPKPYSMRQLSDLVLSMIRESASETSE